MKYHYAANKEKSFMHFFCSLTAMPPSHAGRSPAGLSRLKICFCFLSGSSYSASTLSSDQQDRYSAVPTHLTVACRTTYAVAFSQMPVRAVPHISAALCVGSGSGPGISQTRVPLQTFSRSPTMPLDFNQHGHQAGTQPGEWQRQNQGPTSPVGSEVATSL